MRPVDRAASAADEAPLSRSAAAIASTADGMVRTHSRCCSVIGSAAITLATGAGTRAGRVGRGVCRILPDRAGRPPGLSARSSISSEADHSLVSG